MLELRAKETQALQQIRLADPTILSSSLYQPEGIQSELEQETCKYISQKLQRNSMSFSLCQHLDTMLSTMFLKKITLLGKENNRLESLRLS